MFYILGSRRAAWERAQKDGLRKGEWKWVHCLDDVRGITFSAHNPVLVTHDAYTLANYDDLLDYVDTHTRRTA